MYWYLIFDSVVRAYNTSCVCARAGKVIVCRWLLLEFRVRIAVNPRDRTRFRVYIIIILLLCVFDERRVLYVFRSRRLIRQTQQEPKSRHYIIILYACAPESSADVDERTNPRARWPFNANIVRTSCYGAAAAAAESNYTIIIISNRRFAFFFLYPLRRIYYVIFFSLRHHLPRLEINVRSYASIDIRTGPGDTSHATVYTIMGVAWSLDFTIITVVWALRGRRVRVGISAPRMSHRHRRRPMHIITSGVCIA